LRYEKEEEGLRYVVAFTGSSIEVCCCFYRKFRIRLISSYTAAENMQGLQPCRAGVSKNGLCAVNMLTALPRVLHSTRFCAAATCAESSVHGLSAAEEQQALLSRGQMPALRLSEQALRCVYFVTGFTRRHLRRMSLWKLCMRTFGMVFSRPSEYCWVALHARCCNHFHSWPAW
jgi:hypothetical protein